jgi:raffinose/stachyose/melibiose transport system permease protein
MTVGTRVNGTPRKLSTRPIVGPSGLKPTGSRNRLVPAVSSVVFILGVLVFAAPLIIVLVSALQPNADLMSRGPAAIPEHFTLNNFSSAWTQADLAQFYRNSLLILVVKVPLGILLTSLAAYPIATMRFASRKTILVLLLIGLGVPQVITLYPLLLMMSHIGLGGSLWSLLLPYLAFGTPFEIMVMRGAFASIPGELLEAARVDGASEWYIWRRVCMPMVVPALASLAILDGVATWNEFVIALALLRNESSYTLPLGIFNLLGEFSQTNDAQLQAGTLICIVPMIILFFVARRYLVRGMASGALKG